MSPRKDVRTAVTTLSGLALAVAALVSVTSAAGESPASAATAPPVVAAAPIVSLALATPTAAPTERPATVSRAADRTAARKPARTPVRTQKAAAPKTAAPKPRPARVIRIAGTATSADMQQKLDACNGPIQVNWAAHTTEIAQHNYCGGAWFDKVSAGQLITVEGGSIAGTYVVNGNRRYVGKGASASSLDGLGSLVLQTCVGSRMVLVGLSPA